MSKKKRSALEFLHCSIITSLGFINPIHNPRRDLLIQSYFHVKKKLTCETHFEQEIKNHGRERIYSQAPKNSLKCFFSFDLSSKNSRKFFLHLKKHLNSYMDHNLNRFPYYSEGQYYLTIYFKPSQLSDVNFYVHKLKNKTQTK